MADFARTGLARAYAEALLSHDPSTQNGAVIIDRSWRELCRGHNGIPEGLEDRPDRWESIAKIDWIIHAEQAAIFSAAAQGIRLRERVMICPWAPCTSCARAIIAARLYMLVIHKPMISATPQRWALSVKSGMAMLEEAKIPVLLQDGPIDAEPVRFDGKLWAPRTCEFLSETASPE